MMPTRQDPAAHPAHLPTLTEVIDLPEPQEADVHALVEAAAAAAPAIDIDALTRQLVEQLGPQIEALVEARLRSAVAEACAAAAERARAALGEELRACVDASLREAMAASRAAPPAADPPGS
jgi:hypothetical protein